MGNSKVIAAVYGPREIQYKSQQKNGHILVLCEYIMVLCASNEDHLVVEPLPPPAGAKPGERVSFSGYII
ncbi:hypothetical protein IGI04_030431 [Brassica rapa subsp. trilocularis]|uniref:Uncharacterized protein n=1 Tax=Brassica rapa subsp. trilocularis TaxID=1813537 RepID=A0ABQ7LQP2_BRACM|nr:hypothetical protein IGI04_030431 [Brassica rapa subsp. trilocularis]